MCYASFCIALASIQASVSTIHKNGYNSIRGHRFKSQSYVNISNASLFSVYRLKPFVSMTMRFNWRAHKKKTYAFVEIMKIQQLPIGQTKKKFKAQFPSKLVTIWKWLLIQKTTNCLSRSTFEILHGNQRNTQSCYSNSNFRYGLYHHISWLSHCFKSVAIFNFCCEGRISYK